MIIGIDASRAVTDQRTGTEAYAYFLIRSLIPLTIEKGHHLRLYFNQAPDASSFASHELVEQVIIPFPRLWTHLRLAWELQRRPPDIFFTPAHVIPLIYYGRSVATIHDLGYHHFPEAHPPAQFRYLRWSTRHNGRRSTTIIADSEATKNDLMRLDGIAADKIRVVYPGIDPALLPETDEALLTAVQQKYNITPPYLLFLSTLQPRKNLVRLIQAYAAANVPHQLVLAGKTGWLARPIFDAIAQLPAETAQKISLPGFVEDDDKAALLSGATALLYPSLYEGFGFPVLEAQACGTAVIGANTSSLPEIAHDSALLIDPLDTSSLTVAIQQITQDETMRKQYQQKGFQNVKRFAWPQVAQRVLTILEGAVQ